jgi:succinate dehydrogenase/fumarate reductase flavoprotein subunit
MTTDGAADRIVDVVVFGSGAAGLTAALTASVHGLTVLLCEKERHIGGTTATSGGSCWVPGNHLARAQGIVDDVDAAATYLDHEVGPDERGMRDTFLTFAAEAFEFVERHSAVEFSLPLRYPDYHPTQPGASLGGRVLQPKPFDGRRLGRAFGLIRSPNPGQTILGGIMVNRPEAALLTRPFASWRNFTFALGVLGRHVRDRVCHARGTRLLLGNALVAGLFHTLRERGVEVWTESPLVSLIRHGPKVRDAIVARHGERVHVHARRAIVLATGGFTSSPGLRASIGDGFPCAWHLSTAGATGDALATAAAVGAATGARHTAPMFFMPVSVMATAGRKAFAFPHVIQDRARPGLIAVDAAGRRFVNEADSYHDFVMAMFESSDRRIPAYLVCDRRYLREYGLGLVRAKWQWLGWYERRGYLVSAPTIAALADRIGVAGAGLEASVAQHNSDALSGVDSAFGKGSNELNRFNGDPAVMPNPCLRPIEQPPYFAIAVQPAAVGASVGLLTDGHARVLAQDGTPLEGLYAAGSDQDSVMRGAYPGAGITLGPAITFGYCAVRHAAGLADPGCERSSSFASAATIAT